MMYIGLTIAGFVLGLFIAAGSDEMFGALAGGALGFLVAHVIRLGKKTNELKADLEWLRRHVTSGDTPETIPDTTADVTQEELLSDEGLGEGPEEPAAEPQSASSEPPGFKVFSPASGPPPEVVEKEPSFASQVIAKIGRWFTSGNVPVKVGVLLSFIGVSFLLKFAIDNQLLSVPIEFRLLGVAAAGLAMIVVGWRLRHKLRVYGLSLQGGGAGILFLTIFAAFRIWQLMPAGMAFALLVALAAFTGALSVLQKARWLIILGAVGGFLAPVLASTGQGSHVALFSYYLVLNALILGVSWFHAWRAVNLVGFFFTFVVGSFWGYHYYTPAKFASTEPFLILFFLFYQAIAILYALRQPPGKIGLVDGTLVFGTPVIAFVLQSGLVRNFEYGMAISAAALAVFYALLATWLRKRQGSYLKVLTESFIALAVAFATIAIPLALDTRWTAAAWAIEGAALIWIATRQPQHLANLAGTALIFFSGFAFMLHGWKNDLGWPVLNGNVFGGLLISFSALFGAYRLRDFQRPPLGKLYRWIAWGLFGWGFAWWLATGTAEIEDRLSRQMGLHVWVMFLAASAAGFAWLGQWRQWGMARKLTLLFLPTLALLLSLYGDKHQHFLVSLGWLAWPLAFAVQIGLVRMLDRRSSFLAPTWHIGTAILLTLLLATEAFWQAGNSIGGAWKEAAASAVPGVMALMIWRFRNRPDWPVPHHPESYFGFSLALVMAQAVYLAMVGIAQPGYGGSIPYIPVLNPLDLATIFAGITALVSLRVITQEEQELDSPALLTAMPVYRMALAAIFLVLSTVALVRGVHHLTGVPWDLHFLYNSVVVQTTLSIYWGVLGFAGMIWGTRRATRWVWMTGAGFMALVVIKLFLVDLGNSGTIERIISFIGVGVLLLVVGYFAPAPPRQVEEVAE